MHRLIAFVGAGPTAIYTLQSLLAHARDPLSIVIFEEQARAGLGTPYRPGWNDPAMLANIASIELPALGETLVEWLSAQTPERLSAFDIDHAAIDERAFYPRVILGHYLRDRFGAIVAEAKAAGHAIEVRVRERVTDIMPRAGRLELSVERNGRSPYAEVVNDVVIATGHEWPDEPEVRPGYFASPWPAKALERIEAGAVGIRGTSLSAIDAAVALAVRHGAFVEKDDNSPAPTHSTPLFDRPLRWIPNEGSNALSITMMSRKGLLPEADFYHPIPHEPLGIFTEAAVDRLIDAGADGLLDRTFTLFVEELVAQDPGYAERIGLPPLTVETFCERYFAKRLASDPFAWAQDNLDEAKRHFVSKHVVQWRYTVLRAHEIFARVVPHLGARDYARFSDHLQAVFTDNYATVPHASTERLLALHRAGALEIRAIGEDCRIDTRTPDRGADVLIDDHRHHFPAFIDAIGQRPLDAEAFPFQSLLTCGVVQDAQAVDGKRGIAIDENFHPISDDPLAQHIFLLSLPFILGRHPFSQGLTSSHEMGDQVGRTLAMIAGPDAHELPVAQSA